MLLQEEIYHYFDQHLYLLDQLDTWFLDKKEFIFDTLVDTCIVKQIWQVNILIFFQQRFDFIVVFFLVEVQEPTAGKFQVVFQYLVQSGTKSMFTGDFFFYNNGLIAPSCQILKVTLKITDTDLEFILLVQVSVTRLG